VAFVDATQFNELMKLYRGGVGNLKWRDENGLKMKTAVG